MKSLRIVVMALIALAVVGVLAFTPVAPKALAALSEMQLSSVAQAATLPAGQPATTGGRSGTAALAGDLQTSLEQLYDKANQSVVNIHVTMDASQALGLQGGELPQIPGLPDFGQLFPSDPSNPDQEAPEGNHSAPSAQALGSGFVWDKNGNIVTNNHVVKGATKVTVTFADGTTVPATVVGTDPDSDLAVIKVDTKGLNLVPVTVADSNNLHPGQFTAAIGNPFGLEGTLTFGIVSAVGRSMPANQESLFGASGPSYTIPDIIQTDTPINPGNSGGVLLDMDGNLIGVPTAIESPVGANSGVGFAVPSAIVQNVVPSLIKSGKVEHAWLGLSGTSLNPDLAQAMNLPATQRGALVIDVTASGPAEKAGLKASTEQTTIDGRDVKVGGDVITAIEDQPVKRFDDLVAYLARSGKAGQDVTLKLLRAGDETTVTVTLGSRPARQAAASSGDNQGQNSPKPRNQNPQQPRTTGNGWLGIGGVTVTAEIAQDMNLTDDTQGVLVETVAAGSPAEKAGLVAGENDFTTSDGQTIKTGGDVITAVNGKAVTSIAQLAQTIGQSKSGQKITLTILRDGEEQKLTVTLAARPTQLQ